MSALFSQCDQAKSGALIYEITIRGRLQAHAKAEEAIKGDAGVASSVPAENEFVQVALGVRFAQSVIDTLCPTFEVREDPMDPLQQFMRLLSLDNAHFMWVGWWVLIAQPAVGDHPSARSNHISNEPMQRLRGSIGDLCQANAAWLAVFRQLDRAHNEDFADRRSPTFLFVHGILLRAERHLRLINLDKGLQWAASGIDHSTPELLEQEPGGLVAAEAQLTLQLEGRDPVGMSGDNVSGKKPCLERQMAAMHDRACSN